MIYRREVDGLRALAVLPVLLFHAGFETFAGGFVGVDVFFVISGYLITSIIIDERQADRFSLLAFYERRARRILPTLFVVMAAILPFAWVWLLPLDVKGLSESLVAVSLFASNFLFWKTSGYFASASELQPLLHTWSLAVEEQYYLLFPPALLLAWPLGKRWVCVVLAVVAALSLAAAQWASAAQPPAGFYLLPTRCWELLIGSLAAFYLSNAGGPQPARWVLEVGGWVGLGLLAYATFLFDKRTPFPGIYALVPTIGALLIIVCAGANTTAGRVLGQAMLVGIGLISYSAYLWHQPLLALARHRNYDELGKGMAIALVLSSLGLAYLTWKYVETPFRDRRRFSRAQIFGYSAAGMVAFIAIGLAGHFSKGFLTAKTTEQQRAVLKTAVPSPKRGQCHTEGAKYLKPMKACEYQEGELSWAVFGDSHSVELAYALAAQLKPHGAKLKHFSFTGCVPMFGRRVEGSMKNCADWTAEASEYIAANPSIGNVVVTYRIHAALFGEHRDVYPGLPQKVNPLERDRRWKSLVDLVDHFVQSGKKVYFVLQAPELPRRIDWMVLHSPRSPGDLLGVSRSWWEQRGSFVAARIGSLARQVTVIDPARLFCEESSCRATANGVAYYFDDNHMSVAGAGLVATQIVQSSFGQIPPQ